MMIHFQDAHKVSLAASVYGPQLVFNPLTPELNPSAQRCLTRFFTGDFSS
jgi:hypothetical protein